MNKNNQNQESKLVYELGYLLDPKLSEDKAVAKATKLGELVAQESGEVTSSGEPRMRDLAYEITLRREGKRSDFNKAYFGWIKFDQDPLIIKTIEQKIAGDKDVVRSLIIRAPREDIVPHVTDNLTDAEAEELDDSDEGETAEDPESSEDLEN